MCDTGNCYLEEKEVYLTVFSVIATDWVCGTFSLQSLTSNHLSHLLASCKHTKDGRKYMHCPCALWNSS